MGILDKNIDYKQDPAIQAAQRLVRMTKNSFDQMVNTFNEGTRIFWQNSDGATPAEIAALLGEDAAEIFMLHYKLGVLISEIKPEAIQESFNLIGNFTINEDGTVTILENINTPST